MGSIRVAVPFCAVLLFGVGMARAQQAPEEARARKLYEEGITHYNVAEYDKAIESFKAAYKISKAPGLLFNIAQAYRLKGDCPHALQFYKNYLRLDPQTQQRSKIETRIEEMDKCVREKPARPVEAERPAPVPAPAPAPAPVTTEPAPAPAAQPPVRDEQPPSRLGPILTGGAGVAMAGVGLVLYLGAKSDHDDLEKMCAPMCAPSTWQDAQTKANVSYVLLGVGGAAVAAGVVWWILQPSGTHENRRAYLVPTWAGLLAGGTF